MKTTNSFCVGQLVWCKKLHAVKKITAVFAFIMAPTVYHLEGCGDTGFEESYLMAI